MREDEKTLDEYVQGIEAAVSELEETLRDCIGQLGQLKAMVTQIQAEGPEEQLLNIEGIARYLQVPVHTARQYVREKDFPALQFGKHIRAEFDALKIWTRGHLKDGVDMSLYNKYNKEYHEGPHSQTIPEATRHYASPTGDTARRHRQHHCAVGEG